MVEKRIIVTGGEDELMKYFLWLFWTLTLMGIGPRAIAAPTDFEPVAGGALLCYDAIDPDYFKDYLTRSFKAPYKTEGEAYWFRAGSGLQLYGMTVEDLFVSTEGGRHAFLGVVLKEKLDAAQKKLLAEKGITFSPYGGKTMLRSPSGSILIEYDQSRSKLYCDKYNVNSNGY